MDYDEEVCHRASRKLYDLARSDDDRPFFVLTSFTHPHDPYQCRQEHWDRYRHDDIDMPVVPRIPDAELDHYSRRLMALSGLDKYMVDEIETRRARHAYYGSVSYLDDLVGKLLNVLNETGLDANTAIVLTTDHGSVRGVRATVAHGDRDTSSNLRYKYGRNLRCEKKDALMISDPQAYGLPSSGLGSNFIVAKEDFYFVYPTSYNEFQRQYKDSFQHGGISLEEMVLPVAIMEPK